MATERFRRRGAVNELRDLLPEVLIEAQGCDEITALSALRRTVETLCQSHGFGEESIATSVSREDVQAGKVVRVSLPYSTLLRVVSVDEVDADGGRRPLRKWRVERDFVAVPTRELATPPEGERATVVVRAEFMPDVDAPVMDVERFTKWRHLVVAWALKDLFAMPRQPWADTTRYALYAERADRFLEDFLITEQHFGNDARSRSAAPATACMNVFC